MNATAPLRRTIHRLSLLSTRLWLRLLAFNVLLVFVPLFAVFYLRTYEQQLLEAQERSMEQQGRLLATALGEQGLHAVATRALLEGLQGRTQARLRVLDRDATLIADTSVLYRRADEPSAPLDRPAVEPAPQEGWLYQLGAWPFRMVRRLKPRPPIGEGDYYSSAAPFVGSEVRRALSGTYGAATRLTPGGQRSVTLYSALPIRRNEEVAGVVLVSQSTYQILRDLYEVRLAIFKVFLASLAAASVLSLMVSTTIARPLRKLRVETLNLLDARGRLKGLYETTARRDEIGELQRALRELARRLREHQEGTESLAADVSHEFKNPLASIRSATDLLADVDEPTERRRFVGMVQRDVARLERLLSTLREISTIETGQSTDDPVPVALDQLVPQVIEGWSIGAKRQVAIAANGEPLAVHADPDRLAQVIVNLLDNAHSFSPEVQPIEVAVTGNGSSVEVSVRDHGPGVPAEHQRRVFDRFFSYRPSGNGSREHMGLGLAIVKSIAESYGGSVGVANHPGGGAVFSVSLPRA